MPQLAGVELADRVRGGRGRAAAALNAPGACCRGRGRSGVSGHGQWSPSARGPEREDGEIGEGGDEQRPCRCSETDELRAVGRQAARRSPAPCPARRRSRRARARTRSAAKRPRNITTPSAVFSHGGVRGEAGERRAVVVRRRGERVEHLGEAVRPGVPDRGLRSTIGRDRRDREAEAEPVEHERRRRQDVQARELHLAGADLLAEVLGGAPDHQAGEEDRDDRDDQDAVEPGADAAGRDLAEHHVRPSPSAPPSGVKLSCIEFDRAGRGERRGRAEQGRRDDAEPRLLALHRAAREPASRCRRRRTRAGHRGRATRRRASPSTPTIALPCRRSPTILPKVRGRLNGISSSRKISNRFVHALGFSNGCAELALKNPPPFVPSSLIASWEATGPPGIDGGRRR